MLTHLLAFKIVCVCGGGGEIPLHYPQHGMWQAHIDLLIIVRVRGKDHCWCPYNLSSTLAIDSPFQIFAKRLLAE